MKAQVLTPWMGDGSDDSPFRPQLLDDYPAIASYQDATDQPCENLPTSPNLFVAEVICDAATLDAIAIDKNYHILWRDDVKDTVPQKTEFDEAVALLEKAGAADVEVTLGTDVSGRTKDDIAGQLRAWLRESPKA